MQLHSPNLINAQVWAKAQKHNKISFSFSMYTMRDNEKKKLQNSSPKPRGQKQFLMIWQVFWLCSALQFGYLPIAFTDRQQWHSMPKQALCLSVSITAAGLFGIFTRFPFQPTNDGVSFVCHQTFPFLPAKIMCFFQFAISNSKKCEGRLASTANRPSHSMLINSLLP